MMMIKTEAGVVIILIFSVIMVIFTVVGFNKTAKDLEEINKSIQKTQSALGTQQREINKKNFPADNLSKVEKP